MPALSRLVAALAALVLVATPAFAGSTKDALDRFDYNPEAVPKRLEKQIDQLGLGLEIYAGVGPLVTFTLKDGAERAPLQAPSNPFLFRMSNSAFGVEPGEPNPKKTMKRTLWRHFQVDRPQRVVIHSFGSEVDTALAVYTGTTLRKLKQVAFNDDTPLPGGPATGSLVAFDARPGVHYHVQVGSKTGAEGDVRADVFLLPKAGGITAFLLDGIPTGTFPGADWVCRLGAGGTSSCPPPRFVVHNGSRTAVTVTPSAAFGPGITAPVPFTLAPGATTLQAFAFEPTFDVTTARTVSSSFVFEGRAGARLVGLARIPGIVKVASFDTTGVSLVTEMVPLVQTVTPGEMAGQPLEVSNTGTVTATGCVVASSLFSFPPYNVIWNRLAANGKTLEPALNPAFDVAPGQTVRLVVGFSSGTPRIGESDNVGAIAVECANADPFGGTTEPVFSFDVTAMDTLAARLTPLPKLKGNVLAVKKAGTVMKLTVDNRGGDATLTLTPSLIAPAGDPAAARFKVAACPPTASDAACLRSKATSVTFDVKAGKPFTVKVAVKAPGKDPGFDPNLRRIKVTLTEQHSFLGQQIAASISSALRKR